MRTIDELTREELTEVIKNNEKFVRYCTDYCTDIWGPAYCNVDGILHGIPKTADYEISGYCDYVRFKADTYASYTEIAEYLTNIKEDYCIFEDTEAENITKFNRYAAALYRYEEDEINLTEKDLNYMNFYCEAYMKKAGKLIAEYCGDEYRYFYDAENAIGYMTETEQLEEYRVTDDLKVINLEDVKKVFNAAGLYWDLETIANFMEEALTATEE